MIDHGPLVLQTLMQQTIENQQELVEIRAGVQTIITEAFATRALLDNKIDACDKLIVDIEHMMNMTFDMAQMTDTTFLPRSVAAPPPPSAQQSPSPAGQWPPAGQSPVTTAQSPEPDGPPAVDN